MNAFDINKKLIVFGAGEFGEQFYHQCQTLCDSVDREKLNFVCCIDNDLKKAGHFLCDLEIRHANALAEIYNDLDHYVIVATDQYYQEISTQLSGIGFIENVTYFSIEMFMRKFAAVLKEEIGTERMHALLGELKKKPLYMRSDGGLLVKALMLGEEGNKIRRDMPEFRPICNFWFPKQIIILSDGNVSTCCRDAFGQQIIGNLNQSNLDEIYEKQITKFLDGDLYDYAICKNCIGRFPENSMTSSREAREKWRKQKIEGLQLEITATCNYSCMGCPSADVYKSRKQILMNLPQIFERIRLSLPRLKYLNLFHFGEPLLNNGLGEFVQQCKEIAPEIKLVLSTNGMLMDEKIAKELIQAQVDEVLVSVHGAPGTENLLKYSQRNADYHKVMQNVKKLIEIKKKMHAIYPIIHFKTAIFYWNDTDVLMEQFRKDAKILGLKPIGLAKAGEDVYYWVTDLTWTYGSEKYVTGSDALKELIRRGEFPYSEWL